MGKFVLAIGFSLAAATSLFAQSNPPVVTNPQAQTILECGVTYQTLGYYWKTKGDNAASSKFATISTGFYDVLYRTRSDRKKVVQDIRKSVKDEQGRYTIAQFTDFEKSFTKGKEKRLNRICKRAAKPFSETSKFFK